VKAGFSGGAIQGSERVCPTGRYGFFGPVIEVTYHQFHQSLLVRRKQMSWATPKWRDLYKDMNTGRQGLEAISDCLLLATIFKDITYLRVSFSKVYFVT
jgi:hypothetical protein